MVRRIAGRAAQINRDSPTAARWGRRALWRPDLPVPGGGRVALGSRADQQIAELAMHGWDLAVATGQRADLPDASAVGNSGGGVKDFTSRDPGAVQEVDV